MKEDPARMDVLLTEIAGATARTLTGTPAVIFLLTAVFRRSISRYRDGLSLVYRDVGCLLQMLYLVASALGLGGCAIGGANDRAVGRWLEITLLPKVPSAIFCWATQMTCSPLREATAARSLPETGHSGVTSELPTQKEVTPAARQTGDANMPHYLYVMTNESKHSTRNEGRCVLEVPCSVPG